MAKRRSNKIIQVPMEEKLLRLIDARAAIVAESRAAFIREACQQRLKSRRPEELDGTPKGTKPSEESRLDGELAKLLSKRLPKEKVVSETRQGWWVDLPATSAWCGCHIESNRTNACTGRLNDEEI